MFFQSIRKHSKEEEDRRWLLCDWTERKAMPGVNRRKPLLSEKGKERRRIAEKVGGTAAQTAAECAAVCCCCPCSLVNLVILALYKIPASLCKKAWKRRRLLKMKKKAFILHNNDRESSMKNGVDNGPSKLGLVAEVKKLSLDDQYDRHNQSMMNGGEEKKRDGGGTETADLEKEMWDRFGSGGFWRSRSQRDTSSWLTFFSEEYFCVHTILHTRKYQRKKKKEKREFDFQFSELKTLSAQIHLRFEHEFGKWSFWYYRV